MEVASWFLVWTFGPAIVQKVSSLKNKTRSLSMPYDIFGAERQIDLPATSFPTNSELEQLEGEHVLPGCKHGWYDSVYGGAKLHYRYFLPPNNKPKAVVIYAHGIVTHGGKAMVLKDGRKINASLLSDSLLKEDIALFSPDMIGHGYSEGVRFLIPGGYETNLEDLRRFVFDVVVKELGDSIPLFIMGESYGGCLSILLARSYQDNPSSAPKNFKGLLLPGPAIMADLPPYPVYFLLRYVLAPLFPRWTPFFMPNPLPPERIWKDPEVVAARTDPRHVEMGIDGSGIPFRLGTAANLVRALQDVEKVAIPGFRQPYAIVHGVEDLGVPVRGSDYMWETAETPEADRAYLRKEGSHHDMLADPAAEEAMEFFLQYMKKRMAS